MKKFFISLMMCIFAVLLTGCQSSSNDVPEGGSGNILIEYVSSSGGSQSYKESCFSTVYRVTNDGKLNCYLECSDANVAPEKIDVFTMDMPEKSCKELRKLVTKNDILSLDPESDKDACDGYSYYLRIYDANDEIAGKVGGYMPTNKTMEKIRRLITEITDEKYKEVKAAKKPYLEEN